MTKEQLTHLKSLNLPHATPEILGAKIPDDAPDRAQGERHLATLTEYLKNFVPPSDCICCGSPLGAKDAVDALLGGATFRWGIQHGEGRCSKCGYPARAMHYIGRTETEPPIIELRNFILQYHPSTLTYREP